MKGRKSAIAAAGTFFSLFTFSQLYQHVVSQNIFEGSRVEDQANFIRSSRSWLDRRVCTWFGLCGLAHLNRSNWDKFETKQVPVYAGPREQVDLREFAKDAQTLPEDWSEKEFKEREIPQYVLDHAPLIHLYSGEEFWPGDMIDHLWHTTPHLNYTPLQAVDDHPTLNNLGKLNSWGRHVYLTSDDNPEETPPPEWLAGEVNIPNAPEDSEPKDPNEGGRTGGHLEEDKESEGSSWFKSGKGDTVERGGFRPTGPASSPHPMPTDTPEGEEWVNKKPSWRPDLLREKMKKRGRKVVGGKSGAPAVLIVVPKDDGVVDAFWFFFYSFNKGNSVFNIVFGNHVGDWEHTMVRFQHGVPKAIFFSEHSFGDAYVWDAVEKSGKRPVGFSATGSHAMYATPGVHPYILPGGILHDVTDRGPLWDPTLNMHSYTYDYQRDMLRSSNLEPDAPTSWFYFWGHWGDKFYPLNDPRQYQFLGEYHYVNGPLGPRFKNLGRQEICQGGDTCVVKKWLGDNHLPRSRTKRYPNVGQGEEMSAEDVQRFVGPEKGPA
ncbi:hypothetical protein P280DRAFT_401741 [Massarina eburnea CBS 473.64]|uniref:Vacuolar sorting-associated protein-like protein n=1 Tax=Massarina eburnea CBS 473.64 TaxID=1395130 RepID=A0A6A6RXX9_9PLEO|nr:hypothetical protein P280DRAFT_401741 [Massarina eburnea CBS 473.64]